MPKVDVIIDRVPKRPGAGLGRMVTLARVPAVGELVLDDNWAYEVVSVAHLSGDEVAATLSVRIMPETAGIPVLALAGGLTAYTWTVWGHEFLRDLDPDLLVTQIKDLLVEVRKALARGFVGHSSYIEQMGRDLYRMAESAENAPLGEDVMTMACEIVRESVRNGARAGALIEQSWRGIGNWEGSFVTLSRA